MYILNSKNLLYIDHGGKKDGKEGGEWDEEKVKEEGKERERENLEEKDTLKIMH